MHIKNIQNNRKKNSNEMTIETTFETMQCLSLP